MAIKMEELFKVDDEETYEFIKFLLNKEYRSLPHVGPSILSHWIHCVFIPQRMFD